MAGILEGLTITSSFKEALDFSNAKLRDQTPVIPGIEDSELVALRSHLESCGFTVRRSLSDVSDLAFHLERTEKRYCGVIVLRKKTITIELLKATLSFLECRPDSQLVIVNGCNPTDDEPDEDVPDFWICIVQGGGVFYAEDDEPIRLFQRKRNELSTTN